MTIKKATRVDDTTPPAEPAPAKPKTPPAAKPGSLSISADEQIKEVKTQLLNVTEELQELKTSEAGRMSRQDFDDKWAELVGEQRTLGERLQDLITKHAPASVPEVKVITEKIDEGEDPTNWLLGFWA